LLCYSILAMCLSTFKLAPQNDISILWKGKRIVMSASIKWVRFIFVVWNCSTFKYRNTHFEACMGVEVIVLIHLSPKILVCIWKDRMEKWFQAIEMEIDTKIIGWLESIQRHCVCFLQLHMFKHFVFSRLWSWLLNKLP